MKKNTMIKPKLVLVTNCVLAEPVNEQKDFQPHVSQV